MLIAHAQQDITGVIDDPVVAEMQAKFLTEIVSPLLGFFTAAAFVFFLYGAVKFLIARANNDPEGIDKGKKHLIWAGLGLFIMVSLFGILTFVAKLVDSNIWFLD